LLFKLSQTSVELEEIETDASTSQLWKQLDSNFKKTIPFIEDTVDRWNERTQLQKLTKKSAFNATIIQQVN